MSPIELAQRWERWLATLARYRKPTAEETRAARRAYKAAAEWQASRCLADNSQRELERLAEAGDCAGPEASRLEAQRDAALASMAGAGVPKRKALLCVEGWAEPGELVVGGSNSAVGATSRKLVRIAEVAMVGEDALLSAAESYQRAFDCPPDWRTLVAGQARLTRGLGVGTRVVMT